MILSDYKIALYIRLSVNDKKVESNSIENQRLLLTKYAENMEIQNSKVLEFVDNGYSGTNFERPAMQELLELVKSYQINCIIVKDFSRFGRNYIETGNYMEKIFPFFNVRFISVSDGYDSHRKHGENDALAIHLKNVVNELYARDCAEKGRMQAKATAAAVRILIIAP